MKRLQMAVIGCGHLGRIHARLLCQNPYAKLVAVVDPDRSARAAVSQELGVRTHDHYRQLLQDVEAAIVAAPTGQHAQIAHELLAAGIDLLVEKPLTPTADASSALSDRAREENRVVAVGHVEQFNPAWVAAQERIDEPQFIEASRCSGFTFRSTDVGVVMDLMIHDLEIILSLVDSPLRSVDSWGQRVISNHEDFATARLEFDNGCVAQCKASRVSPEAERTMTIVEPHQQTRIDFGRRTARIVQRGLPLQGGPLDFESLTHDDVMSLRERVFTELLPTTELNVAETNPLADEQQDFIESVRQRRRPRVTAADGARAVAVAEQIVTKMKRSPQPRLHRPAA